MVSRYRDPILLWGLIFFVYNINFRSISSGDALPASLLPFSILEYHNVYFDQYSQIIQHLAPGTIPYMFVKEEGHYLSVYPIVLPILITPLYIIPYILMSFLNYPMDLQNPGFFTVVCYMEKLSASLIASLSAFFIYLFMRELTSRKIAIVTTLIYAFATTTWMISSQGLWQHGLAELFLSVMIYLVLLDERKITTNNVIYLGILTGLYIFNRPSDVFLLIPIFIHIIQSGIRNAIQYLFSTIALGLPFLAYNVHYFGNIIGGYMKDASSFDFSHTILFNFMGLLISPNRGLLIYTPIVVLSFFGVLQTKYMATTRVNRFVFISGICILLQILFYSVFSIWWAGWSYGPRFLTDSLPFMALSLGVFLHNIYSYPVVGSKRTLGTLVIAVLLIWSVSVQVIGAFNFSYQWDADPSPGKDPDRYWNFTDTQIARALHSGPVKINPISTMSTIFTLRKDIIKNPSDRSIKTTLKDDSEWYQPEDWSGIPTRWMRSDAIIFIDSDQNRTANMTFQAISFYRPRTLKVYVGNNLAARVPISQKEFVQVSIPISVSRCTITMRLHIQEGCKQVSEIEPRNSDTRCLSVAVQNIAVK